MHKIHAVLKGTRAALILRSDREIVWAIEVGRTGSAAFRAAADRIHVNLSQQIAHLHDRAVAKLLIVECEKTDLS